MRKWFRNLLVRVTRPYENECIENYLASSVDHSDLEVRMKNLRRWKMI